VGVMMEMEGLLFCDSCIVVVDTIVMPVPFVAYDY